MPPFSYRIEPATALAILPVVYILHRLLKAKAPVRPSKVAKETERVVILGASSGIGRSIAHLYAERGARVLVVGRREGQVNEVVDECKQRAEGIDDSKGTKILGSTGDFASVDDMIKLRTMVEIEWGGLDTLVVAAGVSALRPLMAIAGVDDDGHNGAVLTPQATHDGIQTTVNVATAALRGNYIGPLVSAVSFIPLLTKSSTAPSIALISSVASLIPAPTRSLYGSTKSASLLLYQSLSIEHPKITFTHILPATVAGNFRASAVDGGSPREADPNTHGMKPEEVAKRTVDAVDSGAKAVFMPAYFRFAHWLYWIWPAFVEKKARKKYNF
jgi:short-subunit dehydrogenase